MFQTYLSSLKNAHKFIGNEFEHPQDVPSFIFKGAQSELQYFY